MPRIHRNLCVILLLAVAATAAGIAPAHAAVWRGRAVATGVSPAAAANTFARAHATELRLGKDEEALPVDVRDTPSGRYVRLARYRGGLRVDGGEVVVHATTDGTIDLARTRTLAAFDGATTPAVSHAEAEAVARAASGLGTRGVNQIADLVFWARGGGTRLAWDLWIFAERPTARWRVVVDAETKAVLFAADVIQRVNGSGDVFDPSPVVALQDNTLTDQNDADAAVPPGAYTTVTLLDLDPADGGGFYHLSGPYVRAVDIENPVIAPPAELAPTFAYTRQSDDFEWVMAYYHLDGVERFIQGLGFASINNRTIDVDAHGDDGEDNSHYAPDGFGTGYMSLGDGGVDDAEDAEVVVHEFGHSAQDNQCVNCFFGPEAGAMGEGFGDFLAAAYFLNVSAGYQNECLFDWDSTASSLDSPPCLRRLDTTKRYPHDVDDEVHDDGEIWSGALWDALLAVSGGPTPTLAARDVVLSIVLESHFLLPAEPTFFEGAQALLDAEQALYAGTYHAPLFAALDARGLVPRCGAAPELPANCFLGAAGKSSVAITDKSGTAGDQLQWKWQKGAATVLADYADPLSDDTRYEVCIYDGAGGTQPLFDAAISGGGTCNGKPCWKAAGTSGFKYGNKSGVGSHGITQLQVKAGIAGKSQVQVKGKGTLLAPPDPSLVLPLTVQLLVDDGSTVKCWQSTFTTATKNDSEQLKAKGP